MAKRKKDPSFAFAPFFPAKTGGGGGATATVDPYNGMYMVAGRLRSEVPALSTPGRPSVMSIFKHPTYHTGTLTSLTLEFNYVGKSDGTGSAQTVKCGIQTGTDTAPTSAIVPVLFNGNPTVDLTPGDRVRATISISVPQGSYIWDRTRRWHDGNGAWCGSALPGFNASQEYSDQQLPGIPPYDNPVADLCHSGSFTPGTNPYSTTYCGPANIFGNTGKRAGIVWIGNSICYGQGAPNANSFCFQASTALGVPAVVIGSPAETVPMTFHSVISRLVRLQCAERAKHVVIELGVNSAGTALATLKSQYLKLWNDLTALGIPNVWQCLITRSTTGDYSTLAGQSPVNANNASGGTLDLIDIWFLSKVADGTLRGVIDARGAVMSRNGSGNLVWNAGLMVGGDGTHPLGPMHTLMGAAAAAVPGLGV